MTALRNSKRNADNKTPKQKRTLRLSASSKKKVLVITVSSWMCAGLPSPAIAVSPADFDYQTNISSPTPYTPNKVFYDFGQGVNAISTNENPTNHNQNFQKFSSNVLFGKLLDNSAQSTLTAQAVNFTDQYQNRAIAEWSLQKINGTMSQINDPWVQDTLYQVTAEINAQARQQSLYAVPIVNSSTINAFAIPGGVIGINAGTVMSSASMDEVASVLAHEVAHLSQRHYERGKDNKTKALLIQAAGLVAAAVAASASEGNAATAILAGTSSISRDSAMSFSRANEREADRMGMQIMAQAGYDVNGMTSFFSILNNMSQLNRNRYSFIPSYVRTHPMSAERMSEARTRASQYPKASLQTRKRHKRLYDLLKWRLKVLTESTTESELKSASKYSNGASLALSHWYMQNQRFSEASRILSKVKSKINHDAELAQSAELQHMLAITEADILSNDVQGNQSGQGRLKAVEVLQSVQKVYPERRDLKIYLAYALVETDNEVNAQRALSILQPLSRVNKNDRQVWQGLQLASEVIARKTNNPKLADIATINTLRYRSQDQLWNSRYDKALTSLKRAQEEAQRTQNKALLSIIKQEIEQVKSFKDFEV